MEWCRQYHGEACDPRWIGIARAAGPDVSPGHVAAIMWTLKECASRARPRGSVAAFDSQAISDFFGWPNADIKAIITAIEARGLIANGLLVGWEESQPVKHDRTNAQRQKAYRERAKGKAAAAPDAPGPTGGADSNDRYGVTNGVCYGVTTTEEKEQGKSSFSDASKQDPSSSLKLDTSRTVREQAGAFINPGQFWSWAAANGLPAHIGVRTFQGKHLAEWIERGLTEPKLDEALRRARAGRSADRNPAPVNLGYLGCFIDDVLQGIEPKTKTGGGNERGDELSREFARAG